MWTVVDGRPGPIWDHFWYRVEKTMRFLKKQFFRQPGQQAMPPLRRCSKVKVKQSAEGSAHNIWEARRVTESGGGKGRHRSVSVTIGYMPRTIGYNRLHAKNDRLQSVTCQEQSVTIGYNRLHAKNNQLQSVTCQERSVTIGYMTRTIGYNRLHAENNRLQSVTCQERSVTIGYMPRTISYNRLHAKNDRLQSVT